MKSVVETLKRSGASIKHFDELPTLKSLPFIGHKYLFLPGGPYKSDRLTEAVLDISKQMGPIFRLKLGGVNLLMTTDADDTETLFRNEGFQPIRPPFPAVCHYRKKAFNSMGVVPGNGEEWYRLRKGVTPLLRVPLVKVYSERHQEVARSFVKYIEQERDDNDVVKDIYEHLFKFTIEAISVVCPGKRFRCILENDEQTRQIINASKNFLDGLYSTLIGLPLWKFVTTTGYKKLETSHQLIYKLMKGYLERMKKEFFKNPDYIRDEHPYMYLLFKNDALSSDDVNMLAMEVFFGGIDATATAAAFTLYYLGLNKHVQDLCRQDAQTTELKYLRACVKETMRLNATAGANSRFLVKDTIIGGYLIPKDTLVSAFSSVTSIDQKYFRDALDYCPERWLRSTKETHHKFASLPFGYGPRMCPGMRLAENELILLMKEILLRFHVELVGEANVGMVYRMNRVPDKPIDIKFVNTNH